MTEETTVTEEVTAPKDNLTILMEAGEISAEEADAVRAWKAEGFIVNWMPISGQNYFYRSIRRIEYRKLMQSQAEKAQKMEGSTQAQVVMDMEEALVVACSLSPKIDKLNIQGIGAGVVSTLHEAVLYSSGFNQEATPVRL